jgi:hypothetical protein
MAEPPAHRTASGHPAHAYGRIAVMIVLALMAVSVIYAGWRAIANWGSIRV